MKRILQAAEFYYGSQPSKEDVLIWWNKHRKQDPDDIISMHFSGTTLTIYYRCTITDEQWSKMYE